MLDHCGVSSAERGDDVLKWLALGAVLLAALIALLYGNAETIAGFEASTIIPLIALGALLVFIGALAAGRYRGRFGAAVRDMAIWMTIALVLVVAYSYRSELEHWVRSEFPIVAQRVAGELLPPGESVVVESRGGGEHAVRLRRRSDGHFVVKANVNGTTVSMLVDTGASTIVLRPGDARRIGLDVDRLSYTVPVQTANGMAFAAAVRLRQVAIGQIAVDGVDALVARPGALRESLLGMSFLRRLRSYEFSGDFLTLRG
jgi:aspartyl protease family protein